jgi:hypothetical protein
MIENIGAIIGIVLGVVAVLAIIITLICFACVYVPQGKLMAVRHRYLRVKILGPGLHWHMPCIERPIFFIHPFGSVHPSPCNGRFAYIDTTRSYEIEGCSRIGLTRDLRSVFYSMNYQMEITDLKKMALVVPSLSEAILGRINSLGIRALATISMQDLNYKSLELAMTEQGMPKVLNDIGLNISRFSLTEMRIEPMRSERIVYALDTDSDEV